MPGTNRDERPAPYHRVSGQNLFGKLAKRLENAPGNRGVAAVEVALCLPVLLLVTLLFIEFTNMIFLRQTLKVASYEGIRVAAKQEADLSDVSDVCAAILDSRGVVEYEVSVDPPDFATLPRGTLISVIIEVDRAQNQLFNLLMGQQETIEVQSFGLKE
jgi:hypothetical protein